MIQSRRSRRRRWVHRRWGFLQNPLVRRVQRHASVTALFGSPGPASEGIPSRHSPQHTPLRTPLPVVTAWLAPTPAPGEGESDEYPSLRSGQASGDGYSGDEYIGRFFSEVGTFEESGVPSLEGEGVPAVKPLAVQPDEALPSLTAFSPPGPVRPRSSRPRSSEDAPSEPLQPRAPVILQPAKAMSTSAMSTSAMSTSKSPTTKVKRIQPPAESPSPTPLPQAGQGIIQQEPAETKAEQEGPVPAEDRIWKRLQTIFRKHEEKLREGDGGSSPVPEQPPDLQPERAMMGTSSMGTSSTSKPSTSASEQVVSSSGPEEISASEIAVNEIAASDIASQRPLAMTTTQPEAEIAAKEIANKEIVANDIASQKPLAMTAIPSEAVEPEIAASGIAVKEIAEKEIAASDVAPQRPLAMTTTPREAAQAADQPTQMLQPLPLEEAWPVQRQTPQRARPESQAILPGETPPEILGQEEHALVREALREVSPGQPTDSTVEVITPRRPRPAPVLQQRKERQAISLQPSDHPSPESGKGDEYIGDEYIGDEYIDQAEKPLRTSETVETEIGPLPSDLWELIGESPRPARAPVREESRALSTTRGLSRTMQGAELAAPSEPVPGESPGSTEGEIFREVTPELVQRQASEPSSAGGQAGAAALSTANPPAEMDMDELAVRVYGEVKKRLAVEWERLRRRF